MGQARAEDQVEELRRELAGCAGEVRRPTATTDEAMERGSRQLRCAEAARESLRARVVQGLQEVKRQADGLEEVGGLGGERGRGRGGGREGEGGRGAGYWEAGD